MTDVTHEVNFLQDTKSAHALGRHEEMTRYQKMVQCLSQTVQKIPRQ
jgi:hypothetical protein